MNPSFSNNLQELDYKMIDEKKLTRCKKNNEVFNKNKVRLDKHLIYIKQNTAILNKWTQN